MTLDIGDRAPDFTLPDQHGAEVGLSSLSDERAVLVVFYPFAFTSVCAGELTVIRDRLGDFETDRTTVLTISCDPLYSHRALADRDGLFYPLLSDFWPHGAVSRAYGVFDESHGCARRSSFVIEPGGTLAWVVHNEMGQARDFDEHAARLQAAG